MLSKQVCEASICRSSQTNVLNWLNLLLGSECFAHNQTKSDHNAGPARQLFIVSASIMFTGSSDLQDLFFFPSDRHTQCYFDRCGTWCSTCT